MQSIQRTWRDAENCAKPTEVDDWNRLWAGKGLHQRTSQTLLPPGKKTAKWKPVTPRGHVFYHQHNFGLYFQKSKYQKTGSTGALPVWAPASATVARIVCHSNLLEGWGCCCRHKAAGREQRVFWWFLGVKDTQSNSRTKTAHLSWLQWRGEESPTSS